MGGKKVLCIGTLDTKKEPLSYLRKAIEQRGCEVLLMDVSCSGEVSTLADIKADYVAKRGGSEAETLSRLGQYQAACIVSEGARAIIVEDLLRLGAINAVVGVGGGMGLFIVSRIMQDLPFGLPKLLIGSQKIVQAGLRQYVGPRDVVVLPCIVDIAGLNTVLKHMLEQGAEIIVAMTRAGSMPLSRNPVVFISMLGTVNPCAERVGKTLEAKGFEVMFFHTVGIGGMTLERLIREGYRVRGVVELSLNEIGDHIFGGEGSAGPDRLEAACELGIPMVIVPGNVERIIFTGVEKIPDRYRHYKHDVHNPQAVPVRLREAELRLIAETIAKKLNHAQASVKVLVPLRGFSSSDCPGGAFYDPEADLEFIRTLKARLNPKIPVFECDAHINDPEFAEMVCKACLETFNI